MVNDGLVSERSLRGAFCWEMDGSGAGAWSSPSVIVSEKRYVWVRGASASSLRSGYFTHPSQMPHVLLKPGFHVWMCGKCVKLFPMVLVVVSSLGPSHLLSQRCSGQDGREYSSYWNCNRFMQLWLLPSVSQRYLARGLWMSRCSVYRGLDSVEWSVLLGRWTWLVWHSLLDVGTEDTASRVDWWSWGPGHFEYSSHLKFWFELQDCAEFSTN